MTLLEATNYILDQLGSSRITSLNDTKPDSLNAQDTLTRVRKSLLQKGWWFNTNHNMTLPIDANKEVQLPSNALSIAPSSFSYVVARGTKLFNSANNTYQFDLPVITDLIIDLPWEELNTDAQDLVRFTSAVEMILSDLEDENKADRIQRKADLSYIALQASQLKSQKRNIMNTPRIARARAGVRPYRITGSRFNPDYPGG